MRVSYMEIDLMAFQHNIEQIKKYVGNDIKLIPVIKANAYGTYINKRIDCINLFDIVAVAIAEEGRTLRELGYKNEILILNQPDILDLDCIIENNLIVGLSNMHFLKEVIKRNLQIKVHLEIETGMGRTGIALEQLDEYISKVLPHKSIKVQGIYTHFSVADVDDVYTTSQIEKFKIAIEKVEAYFGKLQYVHSSASNGILNFKNAKFNAVRPGIIMYGYEPFEGAYSKLDLKPVAKLKSRINFIKNLKKGESVSYGRKFIADKDITVATVPLGYADGIRRALTGQGEVVIGGQKVKIIGTICMDSFMIDVTNIMNVDVGDEVYVWDNEIITLDEVAKKCDTINYEILSTISERVPRKFIS